PERVLQKFRQTLKKEELDRADRFHFEKDRRAFVAARGSLREVIDRYTETKPELLEFSYGPYGKPALAGEYKDSPLRFNLSHSYRLGLIAVTENNELGVDVEYMRAYFASEHIARRFFSPREVEAFNAVAPEDRVTAFFRCWTRKEAFIKAIGKGLSQPLEGFDVTLGPTAELLRVDDADATRWSLMELAVGEGYAAALAMDGRVSKIQIHE